MRQLLHSPYRKVFLSAGFVYLLTAYFSVGYFHPDEHFQILEVCNYLLGHSSFADLPWEFHEKIRPVLQPVLGYGLLKILQIVKVTDPFVLAFCLRLVTAFLAWLVTAKLVLVLIQDFSSERTRRVFVICSYFVWFIPLISVRFSSENLAAIAFLAGLFFLLKKSGDDKESGMVPVLLSGLLFGCSFYFRFQMGFAIAGLGLWLLIIRKMPLKQWMVLVPGGLLAILICTAVDSIFYRQFTITPVNYFYENVILNKAASWGTSPWWYYFTDFVLKVVPPFSIILLALFLFSLYKFPRNIFTWILAIFILGHILVPHKELRFMFPVAFGFIYLSVRGYDIFLQAEAGKKWKRLITVLVLIVNIPLFLFIIFSPAQPVVNCYRFLYHYSQTEDLVVLCREKSIYDLVGLPVTFYRSPHVKPIVMENEEAVRNYLREVHPESVCVLERNFFAGEAYPGYHAETIYNPLPGWMAGFNFNHWMDRTRIWKVRKLTRTSDN